MVVAIAATNIPVTYLVFPDEGHGLARPANNIAFNAVTENVLSSCLGGGRSRWADLCGSLAQVKHGAEL